MDLIANKGPTVPLMAQNISANVHTQATVGNFVMASIIAMESLVKTMAPAKTNLILTSAFALMVGLVHYAVMWIIVV